MSDCKRCGSEMTAKTSRTKEDAWECKACADKAPPKTVLSELSSEQIARIIGDEPEPKAPQSYSKEQVEPLLDALKSIAALHLPDADKETYWRSFEHERLVEVCTEDTWKAREALAVFETPSQAAPRQGEVDLSDHDWAFAANGIACCMDCDLTGRLVLDPQKSPPSATDKEGGTL